MIHKIFRFLSSMRFAVILLIACALVLGIHSLVASTPVTEFLPARILFLLLFISLFSCVVKQVLLFRKIPASRRLYHLCIIALHASILMIMIGFLMNELRGYKRSVWISEEQEINVLESQLLSLNSNIRLTWSNLSLNGDGEIEHCEIGLSSGQDTTTVTLTHPGRLGSNKVYYSSAADSVHMTLHAGNTDQTAELYQNEPYQLDNHKSIMLYRYLPFYDSSANAVHSPETGKPVVVFYYGEEASPKPMISYLDQDCSLEDGISAEFTAPQIWYYLTFKYDPGIHLVMLGGLILCLSTLLIPFIREKHL